MSQRSKPVASVSSPIESLHRSTVLLCMPISSVTVYADQGFCHLLLKERPFDFYGDRKCTLISAFGLSCIRSDHLILMGVGKMSRKKSQIHFSKKYPGPRVNSYVN